jgi:hypothetical protein
MPTINELPPAISVSDSDELVVSQSDVARSATRAQLLAGVQPALALPQGSLLGRMSAGVGAPETIALGANLTLAQGALSAPAAFSVSGLSAAALPQLGDLVAMGQGGQNVAATYAQFMGGLPRVAGIDGSGLLADVAGTPSARRIADLFAHAVTIESFGAVGDGVTDDTAAFMAALASGLPLLLGGRTYIVNGVLSAAGPVAVVGVRGATFVRRLQASGVGCWISFGGASCVVSGVCFDAGGLAGDDVPCVQVTGACLSAYFVGCAFLHCGGATQGTGLVLTCAAGAAHGVHGCVAQGNGLHGIAASGSGLVSVTDTNCSSNGGGGIVIGAGVGMRLAGNVCSGNHHGISVGNWSVGGPPSAAASSCVIAGNVCADNAQWGLAVAAYGAAVVDNVVQSNGTPAFGGGVLARVAMSRLCGNIVEAGAVGLDCRGSSGCFVGGNHISSAGIGVLAGGCINVRIGENFLLGNGWGISISGIEPSVSVVPTGAVTVERNWIGFSAALGGGVFVQDGSPSVAVCGNSFNGSGSALGSQAMWLHTANAIVQGNSWNNVGQFQVAASEVSGQSALVLPEVADDVLVTSAPPDIGAVLTQHQVDTLGQVTFLQVTSGGSGYTTASVTITGAGHGAAAQAVVAGGAVVWLVVTNPGSGYGAIGAGVEVAIAGDGSGAAGIGFVGLPVIAGRRLRLTCNCAVRLVESGSMPALQNWTGYDMGIPAGGAVELEGAFGQWRAVQSPPVDYLMPTGDGGAVVQTVGSGDLILRPASGGTLAIASVAEPGGYSSSLGRGSPDGVVVAGPGSDFRNLDGGAGSTLWVKLSGTDSSGWTAIA